MRERDFLFLLMGLAAVLLAMRTGPRVTVIPEDEPARAEVLGVWERNVQ